MAILCESQGWLSPSEADCLIFDHQILPLFFLFIGCLIVIIMNQGYTFRFFFFFLKKYLMRKYRTHGVGGLLSCCLFQIKLELRGCPSAG